MDPEWTWCLRDTTGSAILEDRNPAKKAEAVKRIEALVEFDPDFELDKNITSGKCRPSTRISAAQVLQGRFHVQRMAGIEGRWKARPRLGLAVLPFGDTSWSTPNPATAPRK